MPHSPFPAAENMLMPFTCALVLMGLAAVTGQIILMRELLVVFYGNELSTALILAAWLLWTFLGSLCSSLVADAAPRRIGLFAAILALLAFLLPLSILGVRLSRLAWGIPLGETAGLDQMLQISLAVLGPYCFASGFLFVLGCSIHEAATRARKISPGHVYGLEAVGAGLGGLLFAGLLVHVFNHLQVALLVSAALLFVALRLFSADRGTGYGLLGLVRDTVLVCLAGAALFLGSQGEQATRKWGWQGLDLLAVTDTKYGNLVAVSREEEISFYENGLWMFTYPEAMSAEHSVHFAMLAHPDPRSVLLIGGVLSGSLSEILKHPSVERVDAVELDPQMIAFGRRILPASATAVLDDPRVRLVFTDGRKHINRTKTTYDVILVNLPDPKTAQLNRYYTKEFFQEAGRVLRRGGLVSMRLTSSENIIGPSLAQTLASLYQTMASVFTQVAVIPGGTARFLGTFEDRQPEIDPRILVARINERELKLLHVQEYYLKFKLSPWRLAYLESILKAVPAPRINQDLVPSCYYYELLHWSKAHAPWFMTLLEGFARVHLAWLVLVPVLAAGLLAAVNSQRAPLPGQRAALRYSCLVMGFSEMTLSVLVILVFQIFYGYLYFQLAVLISLNMVGMALGSRFMVSRMAGLARPWTVLCLVQTGMVLFCLLLLATVSLLYAAQPEIRLFWLMEYGFGIWAFGIGLLGGLHFPLASRLYLQGGLRAGRGGGVVYSMDLVGAAVGAAAAGLLLLPALGVVWTLALIACWNLLAVGLLFTARHESGLRMFYLAR
jgi:spermidine synthase